LPTAIVELKEDDDLINYRNGAKIIFERLFRSTFDELEESQGSIGGDPLTKKLKIWTTHVKDGPYSRNSPGVVTPFSFVLFWDS
jgi:hypothetical protein